MTAIPNAAYFARRQHEEETMKVAEIKSDHEGGNSGDKLVIL